MHFIRNIYYRFRDIIKSDAEGYIMLIAAVAVPVICSLLYLYFASSGQDRYQTQLDLATKAAALCAASHYVVSGGEEGTLIPDLDGQKEFIERKACSVFNASLKASLGLKSNPITMKSYGVSYNGLKVDELDNTVDFHPVYTGITEQSFSAGGAIYPESNFEFGSVFKRTDLFSTVTKENSYDPEYDVVDKFEFDSEWKKFARSLSDEKGAGEETKNSYTVFKKALNSNNALLEISLDTDKEVLKVSSMLDIVDKEKNTTVRYRSSYKVRVGKCPADIVIAIPTNRKACLKDNIDGDFDDMHYEDTPIHQIKNKLVQFVRKMMFKHNISFGVLPYSGKVSLKSDFAETHTQGREAISEEGLLSIVSPNGYDEINPVLPIYESVKVPGSYGGSIFDVNNDTVIDNVVGIMHHDLHNFFSSTSPIEAKFYRQPWKLCYGGDISLCTGYCKKPSVFLPNPYTIMPLTKDGLTVFRYLQSFEPFDDASNSSNFLFLPILLANSLLKNNFTKSVYNKDNKKVLILIANSEDVFAPRELTYLGFNNDASYVSMADGEGLSIIGGALETTGGYHHNKIPNNIYKQYVSNTQIKTNYDGKKSVGTYTLKYPKKQNLLFVARPAQWIKVHSSNGHNSTAIQSLKVGNDTVSTNTEVVVNDGEKVTINLSSVDSTHTVAVKFECSTGVFLDPGGESGTENKNIELRRESNGIYICKITNNSSAKIELIARYGKQPEYERLSYINGILLNTGSKTIASYSSCSQSNYTVNNAYNAKATVSGKVHYTANCSESITESKGDILKFTCTKDKDTCNAKKYYCFGLQTRNISKSYIISETNNNVSYEDLNIDLKTKGLGYGGGRDWHNYPPEFEIYVNSVKKINKYHEKKDKSFNLTLVEGEMSNSSKVEVKLCYNQSPEDGRACDYRPFNCLGSLTVNSIKYKKRWSEAKCSGIIQALAKTVSLSPATTLSPHSVTSISNTGNDVYVTINGTKVKIDTVSNLVSVSNGESSVASVSATINNTAKITPPVPKPSFIKIDNQNIEISDREIIFVDKSDINGDQSIDFELNEAVVEEIHWGNALKDSKSLIVYSSNGHSATKVSSFKVDGVSKTLDRGVDIVKAKQLTLSFSPEAKHTVLAKIRLPIDTYLTSSSSVEFRQETDGAVYICKKNESSTMTSVTLNVVFGKLPKYNRLSYINGKLLDVTDKTVDSYTDCSKSSYPVANAYNAKTTIKGNVCYDAKYKVRRSQVVNKTIRRSCEDADTCNSVSGCIRLNNATPSVDVTLDYKVAISNLTVYYSNWDVDNVHGTSKVRPTSKKPPDAYLYYDDSNQRINMTANGGFVKHTGSFSKVKVQIKEHAGDWQGYTTWFFKTFYHCQFYWYNYLGYLRVDSITYDQEITENETSNVLSQLSVTKSVSEATTLSPKSATLSYSGNNVYAQVGNEKITLGSYSNISSVSGGSRVASVSGMIDDNSKYSPKTSFKDVNVLEYVNVPLIRSQHCKKIDFSETLNDAKFSIGNIVVNNKSELMYAEPFYRSKKLDIRLPNDHIGDLSLLIYSNSSPAASFKKNFPSEEVSEYPINGLTNIFVPIENLYNPMSIEFSDNVIFLHTEITNPVNQILKQLPEKGVQESNANIQEGSHNSDILRSQAIKIADKFRDEHGSNGRIYLIIYKANNKKELMSDITDKKYIYVADTEDELSDILNKIAADIENFSEATNPILVS